MSGDDSEHKKPSLPRKTWERRPHFFGHGHMWTSWEVPETVTFKHPKGDYRDQLPFPLEEVAAQYAPVVKVGQWTIGLTEMWGGRNRDIKAAVHIPCCPSFAFNPLKWRGICFGRTLMECYWFGCSRTRWARYVQAVGLGREYTLPFEGLGRGYKDEIASLCWFDYCLGCMFSMGVGQVFSLGGNYGINFSACYSCHAREKLRRKYNLPATCNMPAGIDDCCVHFWCMYCASHQEMREIVLRGLDGPGIHPFDVYPQPWKHVEGFEEAYAARMKRLKELQSSGVLFLPFEERMAVDRGTSQKIVNRLQQLYGRSKKIGLVRASRKAKDAEVVTLAPIQATMSTREKAATPVDEEDKPLLPRPALKRSWTIAF